MLTPHQGLIRHVRGQQDLLGRRFAANPSIRSSIFLATKFANRVSSTGQRSVDSSPAWCREALESSPKRLGLSQIDPYYCHRLDGKMPIEETVKEMAKAKNEGKIRYLGLGECLSDSLRRAHKVHPISAVQIEYSPFALDIENPAIELLKTCRELSVAAVAYSPIGRGVILGVIKSRKDFPEGGFQDDGAAVFGGELPEEFAVDGGDWETGGEEGCTATQLTLAWLLVQGDDLCRVFLSRHIYL